MKRSIWLMGLAGVLAGAMALTGCEWSSGGGAESWNDSNNYPDFSGFYKPGSSGFLISQYTDKTAARVVECVIGRCLTSNTVYSGILTQYPVVRGSLLINVGTVASFRDNGAGGLVSGGSSNTAGSIIYDTGAYSFTITAAMADSCNGQTITAVYSVPLASVSGSSSPIYSFTIQQVGNRLIITDNNGAKYEGYLGAYNMLSSPSAVHTNGIAGTGGQVANAQFTAAGASASGLRVEMVGTLTMENALITDSSGATSGPYWWKTIYGTWIEQGGKTGQILGASDMIVN